MFCYVIITVLIFIFVLRMLEYNEILTCKCARGSVHSPEYLLQSASDLNYRSPHGVRPGISIPRKQKRLFFVRKENV